MVEPDLNQQPPSSDLSGGEDTASNGKDVAAPSGVAPETSGDEDANASVTSGSMMAVASEDADAPASSDDVGSAISGTATTTYCGKMVVVGENVAATGSTATAEQGGKVAAASRSLRCSWRYYCDSSRLRCKGADGAAHGGDGWKELGSPMVKKIEMGSASVKRLGQAQIDPKPIKGYAVLLMHLNEYFVSPIWLWDLGGTFFHVLLV